MKKYVIYKMDQAVGTVNKIVKLQDEQPEWSKLNPDEDFDSVKNWMSLERFKNAIESFVSTGVQF